MSKESRIEELGREEKLVLKPEIIKLFLGNFSYSPTYESFTYLDLNLANRRIEALNNHILEFKGVLTLDLSGNNIVDINLLQNLEGLVKINVARNKIKNVSMFTNEANFEKLKWLDLSNNKFTELAAFKLPKLEYLDISFNKIEKVNEGWTGHPNIKILKSEDNRFKSLAPFKDMPRLEELYLASNSVNGLVGYEGVPMLRKLHLRKNKIEKFEEEMPELANLQYLNLRGNKVTKLDEFYKLFQFSTLTDINVIACPLMKQFPTFNLLVAEILITNPKLKRFCKTEITDSHKFEAVYLAKYRWEKSEEERIRKEREEREREEAEAAKNDEE